MSFLRHPVPLLLVLVLVPGCSRQESQPAPKSRHGPAPVPAASKAAKAAGPYQSIANVPEAARKDAEDFGVSLEKSIRDGHVDLVRAAFDRVAIVDGILAGVKAPEVKLSQFKTGMQQGIQKSLGQIATLWTSMVPKYKGLVLYQGSLATRFRFVNDQDGLSIIDFVVRTNRQGRLVVVNFCNHAMGYDLIEASRQTAAPMLAQLDRSFLERLVNKPGITTEQMKQFGTLSEKVMAGEYDGAIQIYQALPEPLRHSLPATGLYIAALQRNGDTEAYKRALKEAAARFNSAGFRFMLVDVYALDQEFDKAAECVDAFCAVVGEDAALLTLKSIMLHAHGETPNARQVFRQALELEPDCVFVHAKGLHVLLAAKDFPAVRDSMRFLETKAGYNFKGKLSGPAWAEFMKAPESKPWR